MSNLFYVFDKRPNMRVHVSVMKFPGGEIGVNINSGAVDPWDTEDAGPIRIEARLRNSDDIMALVMTVDALRQVYMSSDIDLFVPYFPYARQDRVCNPGEAFSVKAMARIINSLNFNSVGIVDPHSAVTEAVIDRVYKWDQIVTFRNTFQSWNGITLVAPDQGAAKKTEEFAKAVGASDVIYGSKRRELSTGKILSMEVQGDVEGKRLIVLDDICDGGRTFIELHKAILSKGSPEYCALMVTHGIFSKGVEVLNMYDEIFTTDSFDIGVRELRTGRIHVQEI